MIYMTGKMFSLGLNNINFKDSFVFIRYINAIYFLEINI